MWDEGLLMRCDIEEEQRNVSDILPLGSRTCFQASLSGVKLVYWITIDVGFGSRDKSFLDSNSKKLELLEGIMPPSPAVS